MIGHVLLRALRRASCYIGSERRYRFFPLYSCALALLVLVPYYWRFDQGIFEIWKAHRWILTLDVRSTEAALMLAFGFGLIGIFRPGILAKGLSAVGLWKSTPLLFPGLLAGFHHAVDSVLWYGFDIPTQTINRLAGENGNAATMLWCVYLFVLWLALRPLLRRLYHHVQRLEERAFEKWPRLRLLDRPVI